jgi:hypothetical protein
LWLKPLELCLKFSVGSETIKIFIDLRKKLMPGGSKTSRMVE